jgi:hypothetical protein
MKCPSGSSKTSLTVPDFDHRLSMYALAASAVGVGVLALAPPAEGKIVYTKTNKTIGSNATLHLDLNRDGVADFDLKNTLSTSTAGGQFAQLSALADRKQNAVWGHTVPFHAYASALPANVRIGSKGQFMSAGAKGLMAASSESGERPGNFTCTGPWANVTNRFLGLKFAIQGKEHFGWARLNVSCSNATVTGTLTGYAYETVANRPILTGKERGTYAADDLTVTPDRPVTLGRLAQGSKGRLGQ